MVLHPIVRQGTLRVRERGRGLSASVTRCGLRPVRPRQHRGRAVPLSHIEQLVGQLLRGPHLALAERRREESLQEIEDAPGVGHLLAERPCAGEGLGRLPRGVALRDLENIAQRQPQGQLPLRDQWGRRFGGG